MTIVCVAVPKTKYFMIAQIRTKSSNTLQPSETTGSNFSKIMALFIFTTKMNSISIMLSCLSSQFGL